MANESDRDKPKEQTAMGYSTANECDAASRGQPLFTGAMNLQNVDRLFRWQPWGAYEVEAGEQVREALVAAAKAILRNVPSSASRTRALNCLMDARMLANQAITFHGEI